MDVGQIFKDIKESVLIAICIGDEFHHKLSCDYMAERIQSLFEKKYPNKNVLCFKLIMFSTKHWGFTFFNYNINNINAHELFFVSFQRNETFFLRVHLGIDKHVLYK